MPRNLEGSERMNFSTASRIAHHSSDWEKPSKFSVVAVPEDLEDISKKKWLEMRGFFVIEDDGTVVL